MDIDAILAADKSCKRLSPLLDNFKNIIKNRLFEQYHLDNNNVN